MCRHHQINARIVLDACAAMCATEADSNRIKGTKQIDTNVTTFGRRVTRWQIFPADLPYFCPALSLIDRNNLRACNQPTEMSDTIKKSGPAF